MDRRIRTVAGIITILLLIIAGRAGYIQELRADELAAWEPVSPVNGDQARNPFRVFQECRWRRGDILSIDGQVLATSTQLPEGQRCLYERSYPAKGLAPHVVGEWSLHFGKTGLEAAYNQDLIGQAVSPESFSDLFTERPRVGDTLVATIDTRLQDAALEALGGRRGGVVALNPKTGAVYVAASVPSYDPNDLASNDRSVAISARCALGLGDSNCKNPDAPMVSVALQARRPPGSTFKVVTAAAALEAGYTANTPRQPVTGSYTAPGDTQGIGNYGGGACGGTLADALRISCNTAFARIAVDVGPDQLLATAHAMGLDRASNGFRGCDAEPVSELSATRTGCLPSEFNDGTRTEQLATPGFLARAGFGQWVIQTSPFGMAMVAATVANDGFVPKPRFGDRILSRDGTNVRQVRTGIGVQAINSDAARELAEMMRQVPLRGTAAAAFTNGGVVVGESVIDVAGKTGTAQQPSCSSDEVAIFGSGCGRLPHAWFIGFAPVDNPSIAVAVLVERGGGKNEEATGGRIAAPIARRVIERFFELYPAT